MSSLVSGPAPIVACSFVMVRNPNALKSIRLKGTYGRSPRSGTGSPHTEIEKRRKDIHAEDRICLFVEEEGMYLAEILSQWEDITSVRLFSNRINVQICEDSEPHGIADGMIFATIEESPKSCISSNPENVVLHIEVRRFEGRADLVTGSMGRAKPLG